MTFSRRRFLSISAAFAATPLAAQAHSWQGRAFGADVSMTIRGRREEAWAALDATQGLIAEVERGFSLYDPTSALSKLNRSGILHAPSNQFSAMMHAADAAFALTDGLFDPTVQPLWTAMSEGRDPQQAIKSIGWDRVQHDADQITLAPDQALTFNGIAQGYATDLVSDGLMKRGLTDILVNIGEYRGNGGPWTLGVQDPVHGILATRTLSSGAIATSSPAATPLGEIGHILHPQAQPRWSTVSVEAPRATLADSLSTAMVLASRDKIEMIKDQTDVSRVTLVSFDGDLVTL